MSADATRAEAVDMAESVMQVTRKRTARAIARRALLGGISGLMATVVMTAFRMPISRSPPPTANFWAKYIAGGDPADHTSIGLLLHLAYGTGGGLLFALLSPSRGTRSEAGAETRGVLSGLGYGVLLSAFGSRVILEGLLQMDLDRDERFIFYVSHVVYGLTLGAWHGSYLE